MKIDLHNKTRYIARQILIKKIKERKKGENIEIIVGRGLHSENKIPIIKNFVIRFLKSKNIKYKFKEFSKEGVIII